MLSPTGIPQGAALYSSEEPATVRHLGGYGPFLDFCSRHGADARQLATDFESLLTFLRTHATELNTAGLVAAAAVFTGNAIVNMRPDAEWLAFGDNPPEAGNRQLRIQPSTLLEALPAAEGTQLEGLLNRLREWAEAEAEPEPALPGPLPPSPVPRFIPPALPAAVLHDDDGEPIIYGGRWGADGPPQNAYSRVSHPERFAALHAVADAAIDYLVRTFDANADSSLEYAGDLLRQGATAVRAVRVMPCGHDAASLTFVFTDFPGLAVHAGVLHDFAYPACGCDACDETVERSAEELGRLIRSVTMGGYREWVGSKGDAGMSLAFEDGSQSSSGDLGPAPGDRLENARARLAQLPGGWAAWPLRTT